MRKLIYPGEDIAEPENTDDIDDNRPQHVYDELNCEGEQQNDDDRNIGLEDDPDFQTFEWHGNDEEGEVRHEKNYENAKYKKIDVDKDELISLTKSLVPEQKRVLTEVINLAKSHVKARHRTGLVVDPIHLVVHGGAGISFLIL